MPHGYDDPLTLGDEAAGAAGVGRKLDKASGPVKDGTTLVWMRATVAAEDGSALASGFDKGPFDGTWEVDTKLEDPQEGFTAGPALGIGVALQRDKASNEERVVWWWDWTTLNDPPP